MSKTPMPPKNVWVRLHRKNSPCGAEGERKAEAYRCPVHLKVPACRWWWMYVVAEPGPAPIITGPSKIHFLANALVSSVTLPMTRRACVATSVRLEARAPASRPPRTLVMPPSHSRRLFPPALPPSPSLPPPLPIQLHMEVGTRLCLSCSTRLHIVHNRCCNPPLHSSAHRHRTNLQDGALSSSRKPAALIPRS
jgi:hypothetical protein